MHLPFLVALCLVAACSSLPRLDASPTTQTSASVATPPGAPIVYDVEVIEERAHDPGAFTQGLVSVDGRLFESTGLYGSSSLREVDPASGVVIRKVDLAADQFGEGLAAHNGRLIQLTWRNKRALVWDAASLELISEFGYDGEGWGLCLSEDGKELIQSDGTSFLARRDPETFEVVGRFQAQDRGQPVSQLNELECAEGLIWANVWQTTLIVGISPTDGKVVAVADARAIVPIGLRRDDVLNGIARLGPGTWMLTGKRWPKAFVVRLVPTTTTYSEQLSAVTSNVTK